jgi:hypothetical protein
MYAGLASHDEKHPMNGRHGNAGHHASHFRARLGLVKGLRVDVPWLRPRCARLTPLTRPPASAVLGNCVMARQVHGRSHIGLDSMDTKGRLRFMNTTSITPSIGVTIGRLTRLYYAYITTAPAALDAPSTMTLCVATLADLAGLAFDEIAFDSCRARTKARLILVDTTERSCQRRRCREHGHLFAEADPVLVGLSKLQDWLWLRLGAPLTEENAQLAHA